LVNLDLRCGPESVLHGQFSPSIAFDGQLLEPIGGWESVCWESDEDIDYLELEIDCAQGLRIQRQMMLAKQDRFLILADVVLADQGPGSFEYRLSVPLAAGMEFHAQPETREGYLVGQRRRALVMPLSLSEWSCDSRGGKFGDGETGLELDLSGQGRGLYAPLFFDLNPRRLVQQCTWRQLTVAEDRKIQPRDVAVGYRVQIGREQWVVYRSLNGKASRSLLGLNIYNEFALGRFTRKGEMESLVEIE
jgi:hypothetical protein